MKVILSTLTKFEVPLYMLWTINPLDLKLDVRNERLEFEQGQASGAVVAPYLRPFCTIEQYRCLRTS